MRRVKGTTRTSSLTLVGTVFYVVLGVIISIEEPVLAAILTLLFIIIIVHILKVNMTKNRIKMFDDMFTVEGPVSLKVEYLSIVVVKYKWFVFRILELKLALKDGRQLILPRRLFKNKEEELKKFVTILRNHNCYIIFNL